MSPIDDRARAPVDDRLRQLPPLVHVSEHAVLLCEATGLSRTSLYRALADGSLGVRPIRIGGKEKPRLFLRRADLLRALGVPEVGPGSPPAAPSRPPANGHAPHGTSGATPAEEAARRWAEVLR